MAKFTRAGSHTGPGGRGDLGPFNLRWRGATVLKAIDEAVFDALDEESAEVLEDLIATLHRTGDPRDETGGPMADQSFADVEIQGGKRSLVAGSTAPYAGYEEVGTSRRAGHHMIEAAMERHIPHITPRIRKVLARQRRSA